MQDPANVQDSSLLSLNNMSCALDLIVLAQIVSSVKSQNNGKGEGGHKTFFPFMLCLLQMYLVWRYV